MNNLPVPFPTQAANRLPPIAVMTHIIRVTKKPNERSMDETMIKMRIIEKKSERKSLFKKTAVANLQISALFFTKLGTLAPNSIKI